MKRKCITNKIQGCLFSCFLLTVFFCSAQNFSGVDSLLTSAFLQNQFSGTVLVAKKGKVIFEKSYGFADVKTKKLFTRESTFQIASISKQFTAFGIVLLSADGKLHYDDPVKKYLPAFPYTGITIRHLLNHTSGLPDFWNGIRPHLPHQQSNGNREMFDFLVQKNLPLQHNPGTRWIYSDIGYDLLAMLIEKCSGLNYETFMQRRIFLPAHMNDTKALMVTDICRIKFSEQVMGHEALNNRTIEYAHLVKKNDFVFYLGDFYGDGSVISSARDLFQWGEILLKNTLLPEPVFQEAIQPAKNTESSAVNTNNNHFIQPLYGFGWFLGEDAALGKFYYHGGGHPGFVSYFSRYPQTDITLVFLSNLSAEATRQARVKFVEMSLAILKKDE